VLKSDNGIADEVEEVKAINSIIKKEIGNIAICDDMVFISGLPKTRSGKIMRRILRAIAKGEKITQDISTLEDPSVVAKIEATVKG
ncbi:MAG: acetyl-coenzyme A synthetase, partial [Campylobacterales bacterium]